MLIHTMHFICVQVILPAIFICLAMVFSMLNPPVPQEPPLEIHPWLLEPVRNDAPLYMFYTLVILNFQMKHGPITQGSWNFSHHNYIKINVKVTLRKFGNIVVYSTVHVKTEENAKAEATLLLS